MTVQRMQITQKRLRSIIEQEIKRLKEDVVVIGDCSDDVLSSFYMEIGDSGWFEYGVEGAHSGKVALDHDEFDELGRTLADGGTFEHEPNTPEELYVKRARDRLEVADSRWADAFKLDKHDEHALSGFGNRLSYKVKGFG